MSTYYREVEITTEPATGVTTTQTLAERTTWRVWPCWVTWDHLTRWATLSREEPR